MVFAGSSVAITVTKMITSYKNGKVILKTDDGITVTAGSPKFRLGTNSPEIHLWDEQNRYGAVVFEGVKLGQSPTVEKKVEVMTHVLNQYLTYRGTRTSWTINDAWFKKWEKRKL